MFLLVVILIVGVIIQSISDNKENKECIKHYQNEKK